MKKVVLLFFLCLGFVGLLALEGKAKEPCDSLVSVVGLDEYGNPVRQGMGVLVSKDGTVLTSASIVSNCRSGVAKTADGALHILRRTAYRDSFRDTILLQFDAGVSKFAPAETAPGFQPPEQVWVGVRNNSGGRLQEAQLTKSLPFSPRLVLLKLEPENLAAEAGSPILNRKGELVGMLHVFAGPQGKPSSCQFFLAHDRQHLPFKIDEKHQEGNSPDEPLTNPTPAGEQAFWGGVGRSLQQDWKEAEKSFSAALGGPERLPEAYYGRGVARYQLGDRAGAVTDLEEAIRRLPGYALAFLWLGKAEERQGRPEAARRDYRQATAVAPELGEAWFRLGEMDYQRGDLAKAKEDLKNALGDSDLEAKSRWYLGNIALQEKRPEDALGEFKRAITLEPGFFQAYLDGGRLLLEELDRTEEAAAWLREAVGLRPDSGLARYYLALAYALSWNRAGAWKQYFILQTENPELAAQLAVTLERFH
ncbi:MAG: tetratricopeptide repeat-containing serine protease family protein [Desulfobaccales bacterium]